MGMRIHVVGLPGSGKTTLARRLAEHLHLEHIELDALMHLPGWTPRPDEDFRRVVGERLEAGRWVVDGNYGLVRPLVWAKVDVVIWLDLPRRVVFPALVARSFRRVWTREELWNGNQERWTGLFAPRKEDNLLLWAMHKWPQHQELYGRLQVCPPRPGVEVVRLRARWQVDALVEEAVRRWGDEGPCHK